MEQTLYDFEEREIRSLKLDIEVPDWIEQDIDTYQVRAINEGGCASGAYMPAVTYHIAADIMHDMGDEVLDYLEDMQGELPVPPQGCSWSGMAVFYLSCAVETWTQCVEFYALEKLLEGDDE